jgi:GNAT superfamily N-acetyltransferase
MTNCYRDERFPGQPRGPARPGGRTAEVRRLYVRPAHRGDGIARTLMRHAHDHAARHGMTRLILFSRRVAGSAR